MSAIKDQVANAKRVLDQHIEEIRSKWPDIGTGVGNKISMGKITDEIAIIFYVKKKKSMEILLAEGKNLIPKNIYGIPTDVQELNLKKRI